MAKSKTQPAKGTGADDTGKLFELEVALISGMITEEFADENPVIARTIQIRGDQTLEDLHDAIFKAFDRFDEHMYEFQIGGKGPQDPNARRYVLPMAMQDDYGTKPSGSVTDTKIGELALKKDDVLGYWFDFGDDWWHQVTVMKIHDLLPKGKYPRVTEMKGKSPPQYPDMEDMEDEE
jgi:hypothetical protein